MHRARLCAVRSGQRSAQHTQPRSVSAPASSGASDPQNLLALKRAAAGPARTTSSRPNWPPMLRSARAMAPNVSVTPQPPRREQPPPQHHARERAAARLATPARDLAPAQGVVLPAARLIVASGGSLSPAVLAPSKSSQRGNVARARREANAVRSEQATCAVANHMRRAAVQPLQRCAAKRARSAPPRCAYAAPFSVRSDARRCSRGHSRGQRVRSCQAAAWQLSFRCGARCCGPLRSAKCTTATRICRARLRAARQAAQRAPGAAALRTPAGGWAGHRWAAALVSTSSARA
jgi:hypothetical protein